MNGRWASASRVLRTVVTAALRSRRGRVTAGQGDVSGHDVSFEQSPGRSGRYATRDLTPDEVRSLTFSYDPHLDGDPDPGEVIWTWVPYVENDGRGKDRPVLIIARLDSTSVAGCQLTTRDRDGYVSIGSGGWDAQRRVSYLSPQRVLRITHEGMRREGHVLTREHFVTAARAVAQHWDLRP